MKKRPNRHIMIKMMAVSTFSLRLCAFSARMYEMERMLSVRLERLSPDERMVIEKLFTDPENNLTEQQLQDMLDKELSKPTAEINTTLIDDILFCLNPCDVSEEEINAGLAKLRAALRERISNE